MQPFNNISELDKALRVARHEFLASNEQRPPSHPLNAEHISAFSNIAVKIGLPSNRDTIHMLAECCRVDISALDEFVGEQLAKFAEPVAA